MVIFGASFKVRFPNSLRMGFSGRFGIIRKWDRIIDIIRDRIMGAAKATNTNIEHPPLEDLVC
jgi:hypothetical protein